MDGKHRPTDEVLNAMFQELAHLVQPVTLEQRAEGLKNVGELAEPRDVSLTVISKHLQVLMDVGMLAITKDGRVRLCYSDTASLSTVFGRQPQYRILWENRFETSADHPKNEDQ